MKQFNYFVFLQIQIQIKFSYLVDDRRTKNNNDMRVAVLEQRVRELEAAVIPGQAPSTSLPSASIIIPVIGSKSRFFL